MSNVTAREIMNLAAEEFGVLVVEMIGRWCGTKGREEASSTLARNTAVYLIRRHTRSGPAEIARLLGLPPDAARIARMAADTTKRMRTPDFLPRVARIEDRIDALHEGRVARMLEAAE